MLGGSSGVEPVPLLATGAKLSRRLNPQICSGLNLQMLVDQLTPLMHPRPGYADYLR